MKNHFCTIDSIAHILKTTREEIIQTIGHDGSAVIFPEFHYPKSVRGFTPDELIKVVVRFGCMPIHMPLYDSIIPEPDYHRPYELGTVFMPKLCPVPYVAFLSRDGGLNHAVAVEPGFQIYDPAHKLKDGFGPYMLQYVILVIRVWDDFCKLNSYWKLDKTSRM